MMRYTVVFYQVAAVYDPVTCATHAEAIAEAVDFLDGFKGMPGHKREGSLHHDGYARYVDAMGATEACATIMKRVTA